MNELDAAGLKAGPWEEPDPHGGSIAGEYKDGQRTGLWRHYFRGGGVRSEFHYVDGELTGKSTWYRPSGEPRQKGGFLNGEKHGHWKRWTDSGILIDEGDFDNGSKAGTWTYYSPDGSVKKRTSHRPVPDATAPAETS